MPVKTRPIDMADKKGDASCPDRRMDRHEWILDQHEEDIKELHDSTVKMAESISSINLTLIQLKWLAYGGALTYLLQSVGFVEVMKSILS